jgi:starch synthase/alpha-amylase
MTGLLPAAARSRGIPSLITFHNIFTAYETPHSLHGQGIEADPFLRHLYFEKHPDTFGTAEKNYYENRVDFLASGLFAATRINTVSPTFLRELADDIFSELELISDPVRRMIQQRLEDGAASGILNAPMPASDPHVDPLIFRRYDVRHMIRGKRANKLPFQKEMKLREDVHAPVFYWPHRLASPQKGVELMLEVIPEFMAESPTAQFAVVANGQQEHVVACQRLMAAFPGRVAYHSFSRELSQLGKAAADFLLCPSFYEPCGIPQVEGPRYGTLPIVRKTGGLADTVEPLTPSKGNGFVFVDYKAEDLARGIREALAFHARPLRTRSRILRRVMKESAERFNIKRTVDQYIELYEEILGQSVV